MILNKTIKKESVYYFMLHIINVVNKYTNNEIRLLAKIMKIYPEPFTSEKKTEVLKEMGIKKAYLSQLTTSLIDKGVLTKQGSKTFLSSKSLISIIETINKENALNLQISYKIKEEDD